MEKRGWFGSWNEHFRTSQLVGEEGTRMSHRSFGQCQSASMSTEKAHKVPARPALPATHQSLGADSYCARSRDEFKVSALGAASPGIQFRCRVHQGTENVVAYAVSWMLADSSPVEGSNAGQRGQYLWWKWSGDEEEVINPARSHVPAGSGGDFGQPSASTTRFNLMLATS